MERSTVRHPRAKKPQENGQRPQEARHKPFVIRYWRRHDDPQRVLSEIRHRYCRYPAFARLLHAAAHHCLCGGTLEVRGKPSARRIVKYVVHRLVHDEIGQVLQQSLGVWQWLELAPHPYTKRRAWQRVSRARAIRLCNEAPASDIPFRLMRVVRYPADISFEAAHQLDRICNGPRSFVIIELLDTWTNSLDDRDDRASPHFQRDDRVTKALTARQPRESWDTACATREAAWNQTPMDELSPPVVTRFYPARMWSIAYQRIDWGGAMRTLAHRDWSRQCATAYQNLERRRNLAPRQPRAGSWWTLSGRERQELIAVWRARRVQLAADEAEREQYALADVPETDVELLEEQLAACQGKAPRGLIGSLAYARLLAARRQHILEVQRRGVAALETALLNSQPIGACHHPTP